MWEILLVSQILELHALLLCLSCAEQCNTSYCPVEQCNNKQVVRILKPEFYSKTVIGGFSCSVDSDAHVSVSSGITIQVCFKSNATLGSL